MSSSFLLAVSQRAAATDASDPFERLLAQFHAKEPSTFVPGIPLLEFNVPDVWQAPQLEADFWRGARASGCFELEMAMARAMLGKLLVQNKYLDGNSRFRVWPARDRHQLWATFWLALRLLPGRAYSGTELDRVVAAHQATTCASVALAIRMELQRRGLVESDGGCGGVLCRKSVDFLLEGDKLFAVRAAATTRRPWWTLPLAAQHKIAPRPERREPAERCRVVLLQAIEADEPRGADEAAAALSAAAAVDAKFVTVGGAIAAAQPSVVRERVGTTGELVAFAALECALPAPSRCTELRLSSKGGAAGEEDVRLPPFRVDVWAAAAAPTEPSGGGEWLALMCQPMPTADEPCNEGRCAVRCFLPHAVALGELDRPGLPAGLASRFDDLLEGGVLARWPSKQRQQALATLWLALHLLPGREYSEAEIDWLVGSHFVRARVPDCPMIRKEFERRGLVRREPGGGTFLLKADGLHAALAETLPPTVAAAR